MKGRPSVLIVAGEKSGEEHALSFFDELKKGCPELSFYGVGGDDLKAKGMEIIYSLNDFSSWGISGVVTKIPFYKKALAHLESEVLKRQTKVAILIDFQTFNMKLAQRLKEQGVKVLYYVAPQAWAWKSYRTKALARDVEKLFTILPFEKEWFQARGVKQVFSTVHPLALRYPEIIPARQRSYDRKELIRILLLPGSRGFEVSELLPEFISAVRELKEQGLKIELGIVKSRSLGSEHFMGHRAEIDHSWPDELLEEALKWADFSFAASGTVTLACALYQVPTIVCYKGSLLNEFIYETFVSYRGPISLANIIHNERVFPEYIQHSVSGHNIAKALLSWVDDSQKLSQVAATLARTRELLLGNERPSADIMLETIRGCYE